MTDTGCLPRDRVAALVNRTADDRGVAAAALRGPARHAPLVRARFAIAWVARVGLRAGFKQIARQLGDRDHTTIIHACRRAEALRKTDPDFRALTDRMLVAALGGTR